MTAALQLLRVGPATSVQDAGRHGFLRFGVTPAGPIDWVQHATANLLAGNAPGAAAIEAGPGGLSLTAEGAPLRLGIAAPGFRLTRDGSALPTRIALTLRPGQRLDLDPGPAGLWAYLSPAGGFDAAPVMGSLSTHARSALGPFGGTGLTAGQSVPLLTPAADDEDRALYDIPAPDTGPIRFVPGPQADAFTAAAFDTFTTQTYTVAPRSDRMAYRLAGPPLDHARGHDIVSDGIPLGAIQVPGDGLPLVLMADRQPTGGYPKLGCVIRADLPRLAQSRPGAPLRFAAVTVEQAVDALRQAIPDPAHLTARLRMLRTVASPGPYRAP